MGCCIELRHCGQSPSSAAVPVLQQQIEMATRGVVRCSSVTQEGVSLQRLSLSLQSPYPSKASCQRSLWPRHRRNPTADSSTTSVSGSKACCRRFRSAGRILLSTPLKQPGGVDELVSLIEQNTGLTPQGVREQLEELLHSATDRSRDWADSLDPLEEQLEQLLDELNSTLRPKIEAPVRQRPLLAVGVALGVGLLLGSMLRGGRRS